LKPDGNPSILGVYKGNAGKQLKIIGCRMLAIFSEDAEENRTWHGIFQQGFQATRIPKASILSRLGS
jgi:hypothetical protein